jgi:hypothetical protein
VRVHDLRPEAPRGSDRVARELEVPRSTARPSIDDGVLGLVSTCDELAFDIGDENAEIRIVRARVHL